MLENGNEQEIALQLAIESEIKYIKTDMPTQEFIDEYVYIENKDNPGQPVIDFKPWESQKTALQEIIDNKLTIILKARQLGFTWLVLSLLCHLCIKFQGYSVIMLSETELKSVELIKRVDFILSRLPTWLILSPEKFKKYEKEYGKDSYKGLYYTITALSIEIKQQGRVTSTFKAQPATEGAGRSLTADFVFFDEWAFHKFANDIFDAAFPTMNRPDSGKFVGLSTNKRGTFYEGVWRNAVAMNFHKIFRNCFADPRRTLEWYESSKATLRSKMEQEFPRCVAPGTRVGTELGIIKIETALVGIKASHGTVTATHEQPESPVAIMTTKMGYELTGTYDHPVKMKDGSFCDLINTNGCVVQLAVPMGSAKNYTVAWSDIGMDKSITCTPELAEWVGYFLGDGCYSGYTLDFAFDAKDQDVVDRILYLTKSIFGISMATRIIGKNKGCLNARCKKPELAEPLMQLGVIESGKQWHNRVFRVPECVWRSSVETRIAFLRGLFEADGSAAYPSSKSLNVKFFAKDSEFTKDVQLLLLSLGITSYRRLQIKRRDGKVYSGTEMALRKEEANIFAKKVGFIGMRKNGSLKYWLNKYAGSTHSNTKPMVFEDTVVSVEPCGVSATYNLTVEGRNTFDANGIYTHNTEEEALRAGDNVSFPEWNEATHVCKPFPIPAHWRKLGCIDNGYNDPFYWGKLAISEDGIVYLYYEQTRWRSEAQVGYSDQARIYNASLYKADDNGNVVKEKLDYAVAGLDAWSSHHRDTYGKNLIDYYRDGGLKDLGFIPAVTDRKLRKATFHEYLKPFENPLYKEGGKEKAYTAKFQVFDTCEYFISIMPDLVNDDKNTEIVADLSEIDHAYDSVGYGLISHHVEKSKATGAAEKTNSQKHKERMLSRGVRSRRR